tara:strand:+ start:1759 stop:1956 length:198 start_codon:yes stop_codon:yes gene_type:complete
MIGETKMTTKVFIELEFESQSVSDRDVYDYLKELMDNECLDWDTNKTLITNRMRKLKVTRNPRRK